MNRQIKGIWIPINIWISAEISWFEKCLLAEIWHLSDENGCYATNEYLAKFMGTSAGYVANCLSNLRKKNLICDMQTGCDSRRICVNFDKYLPENMPEGVHTIVKGGSHYCEGGVHNIVNKEYNREYNRDSLLLINNKEGENKFSHPPEAEKKLNNLSESVTEKKRGRARPILDTSKFPTGWRELADGWIEYRAERKPEVKSQRQLDAWMELLKGYSGGSLETAKQIILTATGNGWQGIRRPDREPVKESKHMKLKEWYGDV